MSAPRLDSRRNLEKVVQLNNLQELGEEDVQKSSSRRKKPGIKLNRQISIETKAAYRERVASGMEEVSYIEEKDGEDSPGGEMRRGCSAKGHPPGRVGRGEHRRVLGRNKIANPTWKTAHVAPGSSACRHPSTEEKCERIAPVCSQTDIQAYQKIFQRIGEFPTSRNRHLPGSEKSIPKYT